MTKIMHAAVAGVDELFDDANRRLWESGFADGLPVVPPTMARVRVCYEQAGLEPERPVGALELALRPATVFDVAVNAVMAGCDGRQLRLLVAAVNAATEPALNLLGIQTTTGSATVAMLVNGPVTADLGINGGSNCLGGGDPANARLGRALRLCLINLGGARSGGLDAATMGQPAKMGLCFAENEAQSPWPALHVERGFAVHDSTVTLFAISGSVEVVSDGHGGADEILQTLARSMTIAGNIGSNGLLGGGEPVVVLAPEHAQTLAGEGFDKAGVKRELWRRARLRLRDLAAATRERINAARREAGEQEPDAALPLTQRSADIAVLVAGGEGVQSTYLPGWSGGSRSVIGRIEPH